MLRSFRVGNHESIRDEQELLLIPGYDKIRRVVPVAAVYGANASGKSNLLDALGWMRTAVRESYARWEPGQGVPRQAFRLDPASRAAGSVYVVELVLDGVRYTYGFEVDDERVRAEWLYTYPRNRRRVIFDRTVDRWAFGVDVDRGRMAAVRELTRPEALFLSVAARSEVAEVAPVYRWFQRSLVRYRRPGDPSRRLAARLRALSKHRATVLDLTRAADVGITSFDVPEERETGRRQLTVRDPGESRAELIVYLEPLVDDEVLFFHGADAPPFTARDESAGTLAWLDLVCETLTVLDSGSVLLVDELDMSLHPRLIARLIELFKSEQTNPVGAQLVFTTHDATLLGTGLGGPVLGRDEVWFVEKGPNGATTLFPLTDFHPRTGENTERRYLGGSYGAVPAVFTDSMVDVVRSEREGPGRAAS